MKLSLRSGLFFLASLVLIGILAAAIITRSNRHQPKPTTSSDSAANSANITLTQPLTLLSGKVALKIPPDWSISRPIGHCMVRLANGEATCLEEVFALPSGQPLSSANGKRAFAVSVAVFQNRTHMSAQVWLETAFGKGPKAAADTDAKQATNGLDSYYRRQASLNDQPRQEVFYTVNGGNQIILLRALVYDPSGSSPEQTAGDYRRYESVIADIARTIKFQ